MTHQQPHTTLNELQSKYLMADGVKAKNSWEAPILFDQTTGPTISANMLPGNYKKFVEALSEETETDPSLSLFTILGVLSSVSAGKLFVSPRAGWIESCNIYTMIALPPGNSKSLIMRRCTAPIVSWEVEQADLLRPEIIRKKSERKTQEKVIDKLRSKCATLHGEERDILIQEIADLEMNLPEPPVEPRIFSTDCTNESLSRVIAEQNGRHAIMTDEGGVIDSLSGLYSRGEANINLILNGIDGGTVRIHRSHGSISVNPYLTISMTIQPAIIEKMGNKKAFSGKGFLERVLYVLPHSKLGFRKHNQKPVEESVKLQYEKDIKQLLDQFHQQKEPTTLNLSSEALKLWSQFRTDLEVTFRPGGGLNTCIGWAAKLPGMALRLAGLLHIASGSMSQVITEQTMNDTLNLAALLTEHALVAYSMMRLDDDSKLAAIVCRWICKQNQLTFTRSDFTNFLKNRNLDYRQKEKVLDILYERNIISKQQKPATGGAKFYYVNPQLVKQEVNDDMA